MRRAVIAISCLVASLVSVASVGEQPVGAQGGSAAFVPLTPDRAFDSRLAGAKLAGGGQYTVSLANVGVPGDATAVELNVTVTEPDGDGYITLFPAGGSLPLASNLNFSAGETTANHAIVSVNGAAVTVLSSVNAHVILDIAGYWKPTTGPATAGRFVAVAPLSPDPPVGCGGAGLTIRGKGVLSWENDGCEAGQYSRVGGHLFDAIIPHLGPH